ncbi:RNAPII degradation factor [Knufia obscura]|uniref:RNAPII degradation factor n=1 Tax=Knufia obscura TaxID=1635080 RepID=A0ABR0R8B6_9EURO|nr:RNAPII degradation factor [Knufia obscura]
MSEVQSRGSSARGRGGFRGGRGGYRGARGGKSHSARPEEQENIPPLEEQGEVGELKAKYADKLPLLREICVGWGDDDLVMAIDDSNGDEMLAMERITSGAISKWESAEKKQPKTKETSSIGDSSTRGRGRGGLESRGRGRGAERGARGGRGARAVSQANGTKHTDKPAKPVDDGWGAPAATTNGDAAAIDEWANEPGKDKLDSLATNNPQPAAASAPSAPSAPAASKSGGWASLFAKPNAPPAPKAEPAPAPAPAVEEPAAPEVPPAQPQDTAPAAAIETPTEESLPPPPIEAIQVDDGPTELPSAPHSDVAPSDMTPGADELTKENVNRLPDASHPLASMTVASTTASTADPVNPALPQEKAIRPGMSGHATSALRATTGAGRSASYSRKVMDQQEAVVMPGNHAVDRAAVQFGKMGLDADDADADEDREEPETRTQLPDDSPAAPRASLPPAPMQSEPQAPAQPAAVEPPTEPQAQRPPSGLPSAPQALLEPSPPQPNAYPDQYRYGHGQKPYDPFSQQPQHPQAPSEPFSNQLPGQSQGLPSTSQQDAYQQYYGREYASYYGYGQGQGHDQQRSGSAFGTSAPETQAQYAAAGPRGYGSQDLASGNNTPNPHAASHQNQPSAHMQQGPNAHAGYPYGQYGGSYGAGYPQYGSYGSMGHGSHGGRYGTNRPAFDDVRRQQQEEYYGNQYGYGQNQGYSASYGKSSMYGGPQQQQYSHDYSSSPSGNAAFAGRDGYGRTGSTQPNDAHQSHSGSNAYGASMQDPFARTASGFGQSQHTAEDPAKPTGPSPNMQSGRPGSAAQGMGGQQQSSLPHPQNNQQAFAGYPQYSGFGNQNTQHSGYGGYGSNNAFAGYGAAYGGRGWAGQYGSGQH